MLKIVRPQACSGGSQQYLFVGFWCESERIDTELFKKYYKSVLNSYLFMKNRIFARNKLLLITTWSFPFLFICEFLFCFWLFLALELWLEGPVIPEVESNSISNSKWLVILGRKYKLLTWRVQFYQTAMLNFWTSQAFFFCDTQLTRNEPLTLCKIMNQWPDFLLIENDGVSSKNSNRQIKLFYKCFWFISLNIKPLLIATNVPDSVKNLSDLIRWVLCLHKVYFNWIAIC